MDMAEKFQEGKLMRILIATDGSEFSLAAVEKACDVITKPNETEIKVVSVFEALTVATEPFMAAPDYYNEVAKGVEKLAESYVARARTTIENRLPNTLVTSEVMMGNPAETIVENAEKWGADMIVVGSHGRGFWGRTLLGSVSDAVVHHAGCSVFVVRSPDK